MVSSKEVHAFIRRDPVLFASLVLALLSMLLVPPSAGYADYIDVRTLAILMCLMVSVAGISSTGAFDALARGFLGRSRGIRSLVFVLVGLPFTLSMFITNDVALLTFVPFAILVLTLSGRRDLLVPVTVLQTLAANLGSMLLPFGNPQNIFIASHYDVGLPDFVITTGVIVLVGAVVLVLIALRVRDGPCEVSLADGQEGVDRRRLGFFTVLFAVCVLAVLRLVPYQFVLVLVVVLTLVVRPRTLVGIDWGLLLTFVFLFVFAGNLASLEAVSGSLGDLMRWDPVVASAVVSQFISNVPATVMLSNFTEDWAGLLAGANIGGFGTPIASMASIITLRIYSREEDADRGRFLRFFMVTNVIMFVILLTASLIH